MEVSNSSFLYLHTCMNTHTHTHIPITLPLLQYLYVHYCHVIIITDSIHFLQTTPSGDESSPLPWLRGVEQTTGGGCLWGGGPATPPSSCWLLALSLCSLCTHWLQHRTSRHYNNTDCLSIVWICSLHWFFLYMNFIIHNSWRMIWQVIRIRIIKKACACITMHLSI